jgi:hypothetical protein
LESTRSLFVLNTSELKPQLRRLEALLWELAADFYRSEGKRIKNLKHKVNKSNQQRLYVRHHFKVAYYAEVCRDYPSALKYYRSSYGYLKQLNYRGEPVTCMEIKAMSHILSFKVCLIIQMFSSLGVLSFYFLLFPRFTCHVVCRYVGYYYN